MEAVHIVLLTSVDLTSVVCCGIVTCMYLCAVRRKELEEEEAAAAALANEAELRSVTSKDFGIDDFVPKKPAPTAVRILFDNTAVLTSAS